MGNIGFPELLLIFAFSLIVLGPKRLLEVAKALGEAMRSFKSAMQGYQDLEDKQDKMKKELKG